MNIILFEEQDLGKALPRRDERTIHLLKVLHKKAGDPFDAGVLGGNRGTGIIEKINLDGSILYSLNLDEAPPPRPPLRLAVGFPRPIQLRRLLRDLSNLGVEAVDLMGTELGDKSYRDTKLLSDGGAQAALIEGAVQSRDTRIPSLSVYTSLEEWLAEKPWAKSEHPTQSSPETVSGPGAAGLRPLLVAADNVRPGGSMARLSLGRRAAVLAIGPERGWSDGERDRLEAAGFLRLSMGERALRTETACVAAAILALEKIGELG
ncbi:ribosomal RNA small subunit methyltransferase E [Spirochaetia bacterium]|nr:ribosomal RNA small subunit methyltransferase E [Spirochaetia bacterium]